MQSIIYHNGLAVISKDLGGTVDILDNLWSGVRLNISPLSGNHIDDTFYLETLLTYVNTDR